MPIFQNTVVTKYLKTQDKSKIESKWELFKTYFQNLEIQENIRNSKEEQFQEGFLRELFVKVLGYTLNPEPNFNLTTELKNVKDSKKADGAIIINDDVKAVIELKGTNTTDLSKIEAQAFGYKNNQPKCTYVITSNFEKIRFYIDNAIEHLELNLFTLTEKEFELLYLCLAHENISKDIPSKVKKDSLSEEDVITKSLYKDYSVFKRELYQNLVSLNPQFDSLTLFKQSQTLLDRFLFLFFAEDRHLLPPNSVRLVLSQWKKLQDLDAYTPLFDRFKKYFGYLNTGFKGKQHDIYAYNGGLFKPNEVLDAVVIDDDLLYKHTLKLSDYDFDSEVDVNILGHIFENSLNEIDEVKAELEGKEVDKSNTKRKKDGVFYTPKYITKYIVENTVGKLCEEKKAELEIIDEDYITDKKRQKKTIKGLIDKLTTYRDWLLQLTICDPACGSGAFLNQALDFLILEHRYIDELQAKLFGDAMVLSDVEKSILENNLFGVDLNEESVEIAKLSLWLRTAQPNRKLNDLSNNIKCGNSLIDDSEIAGAKAFNWQEEFPQIFAKGGFDVVIGNPPYVRQELIGEIKPYLESNFKVYEGTSDLFAYFYEQSFKLLKQKGFFGFISNTFDKTKAANKLRNYLTQETSFLKYIDFTEVQIFEGATTYPIILIASNSKQVNRAFTYIKIPKAHQSPIIDIDFEKFVDVPQESLDSKSWNFNSVEGEKILDKIKRNENIRNQYSKCYYGIKTGFNEAFIINAKTKTELELEHQSSKELIKPFYEGKDISKWTAPKIEKYVIFSRRGTQIDNYPAIKKHFEKYRERLTPRNSPEIKIGRKPGPYKWFEIQDSVDYYQLFEGAKITWANLQSKNKFCLNENGYYINAPSVILPTGNKSLLCILNSKITWFFLKSICVVRSGGYIEVKPQYFEQIPIPKLRNEKLFEQKANMIIDNTTKLQSVQSKLQRTILREFTTIDKLSKKLESWYELTYADFLKELKKKKVELSLSQKAEWEDYFLAEQQKALELKAKIDQTDKEIDQMVYELYGLTQEEIEIVENS